MIDRYCRRNPFSVLVLAMLTLCAIIMVIFHNTINKNISRNSLNIQPNSEALIKPIKASKVWQRKTVILLQQSPVLPMKQLNRLNNIDNTWANWTNKMREISVTAAVSYDTINNISWSNVRPLPMFPLQTVDELNIPSPFHNMIRSLLTILSGQSSASTVHWIVMGNDHTFIFPMNLQRFLGQLDSSRLIYSGNKLHISYKKKILSFASGGSGAVFSHTTAKLIVVVCLAVTKDPLLLSLLPKLSTGTGTPSSYHSMNNSANIVPLLDWDVKYAYTTYMYLHCIPAAKFPHLATCSSDGVVTLNLQHSGPHTVCVLSLLRSWLYDRDHHQRDTVEAYFQKLLPVPVECKENLSPLQLKLILSKDISLIFRINTANASTTSGSTSTARSHKSSAFTVELVDSLQERTTNSSDLLTAISELQLQKECTAPDKWTKTNPGIVLANCLSQCFGVPFTSSTSTDIHRLPGQKLKSQSGERFNVYGTLRTILNDFDDWYYDCKRSFEEFDVTVRTARTVRTLLLPAARDVISFHYISEMEAQLLYELLSPLGEVVNRAVQPFCSPSSLINTPQHTERKNHDEMASAKVLSRSVLNCTTVLELRRLWPHNSIQAGPYARPVAAEGIQGEKEITALHSYLSQIILY